MKMNSHSPLRIVAAFEALKGIVVLAGATGLSLVQHDLHQWAVRLVRHAHLDPASHYPQIFLDAASHLQDTRLVMLALGALAYATVRLVEAYGLFKERAWAEVLAAGSGAIYVPLEVAGLLRRPTWLGAALFLFNVAVVVLMLRALLQRRRPR